MKKQLYKLTVETELNEKNKTIIIHVFAETYEIAETVVFNKLEKGNFNVSKFKVIDVENLPYIDL